NAEIQTCGSALYSGNDRGRRSSGPNVHKQRPDLIRHTLVLQVGEVDDWTGRFAVGRVLVIADYADDLGIRLIGRLAHTLTERRVVRKVRADERLTDDHHRRAPGAIAGVEVAAAQHGNAERLEVSRAHAVHIRSRATGAASAPVDLETRGACVGSKGQDVR